MNYVHILNEVTEETEFFTESVNGNNVTKIKGLFTTMNERNKNGRIYPQNIFEREVQVLQESIKRGAVLGEMEHPQRVTIDYENAVIKLDKLFVEGSKVFGEASIIPAGKGLIVEGLVKVGAQIGVSSRATGSLNENKIVKDDLKLYTYDVVSNPSNHGSYLDAIYESKQYIIESNGELIAAYDQLEKDLSKYSKTDKSRIVQEAIMKFIRTLK